MVNRVDMRVSPTFHTLMKDVSRKNGGLSMFSVTEIVAIHLKTKQTEITIPNLTRTDNSVVKAKKVFIKQNGEQGAFDFLL